MHVHRERNLAGGPWRKRRFPDEKAQALQRPSGGTNINVRATGSPI